jgi:hypothetical protein
MSWISYSGEPWLFTDGNFSLGPGIRTLSFLANACMIGSWPFVILFIKVAALAAPSRIGADALFELRMFRQPTS